MKSSLLSVVLALVLAVVLGLWSQSRAPGPRPNDQIQPVPASWYQALPQDPARATQAFLDRVPPVIRERGDAVSQTRYWVLAARVLANLGAMLLFLRSGAAAALASILTRISARHWACDLIFALAVLLYLLAITLPVEVVASYLRFRVFGFSDRPFAGWLQDHALEWLGIAPFYAAGIAAVMAIIRRRPHSWFLRAGLVYLALAALYVFATPLLIEPLTNTYTPLPPSLLKQDIVAMAHKAGIPVTDIYTDDASRQSRILNAHVSGAFGSARITIDDTALGSSRGEMKALVAHEMGHYAMWHPLKMVAFASFVATLGFAFIAWAAPLLLRRYGRTWQTGDLGETGTIAVFWLLFLAWGFVADPLTNVYSRVQETQADAFSLALANAPGGLAEIMIHDADIARLKPTWLDVLLFYDHPGSTSRIEHAMRWRADHFGSN